MPAELGQDFRAFTPDEWMIAQQLLLRQAPGASADDFDQSEYFLYQHGQRKDICHQTPNAVFYICAFCELMVLAESAPATVEAELLLTRKGTYGN